MKIILYSANIGDYDHFYHPTIIDTNIEYVLFTDNPYFKSKVWNVKSISNLGINHLDNRKKARYIKINSNIVLPPHNISIWMDHCFKTKIDNVNNMLQDLNWDTDKNIMIYKHCVRDCTYDEADVCIQKKLDTESIIRSQVERYRQQGFPTKFGLFETGFMIRRNNDQVNNFNKMWWEELLNNSGRDQISQCYSSWKSNTKIHPILIGKSQYDSPYMMPKTKHNKIYKY